MKTNKKTEEVPGEMYTKAIEAIKEAEQNGGEFFLLLNKEKEASVEVVGRISQGTLTDCLRDFLSGHIDDLPCFIEAIVLTIKKIQPDKEKALRLLNILIRAHMNE